MNVFMLELHRVGLGGRTPPGRFERVHDAASQTPSSSASTAGQCALVSNVDNNTCLGQGSPLAWSCRQTSRAHARFLRGAKSIDCSAQRSCSRWLQAVRLWWRRSADDTQICDNGINICVGQCRGISWRHLLLWPRAHGCRIAYELLETCIREIRDRGHWLAEIRAKGTFASTPQAMAWQALRHIDRLTTPSRVVLRYTGSDRKLRPALERIGDAREAHKRKGPLL